MRNKSSCHQLTLPAIIFLLVLTGCNPPKLSPISTAQKTPTAPYPTVIATSAKLPPSSTAQDTLAAAFPTLTTFSPSEYMLKRTDLQQLISLISSVRAQAAQNGPGEDWPSQVASKDAFSLDAFIAGDLGQHYAENMPNASMYAEKLPADWSDLVSLPSFSIIEILSRHSVVDYFNENKVRFSDKEETQYTSFRTKAYLLDIEKVPGVERNWLIKVDFDHSGIGFWLALAEDTNGTYNIIRSDLGIYQAFFDQSTELKMGIDINNDYKNDILIEKSFNVSNVRDKRISIYTLDQQHIHSIGTIVLPQEGHYENLSQYDIGDHNQDGLLDIEVTTPRRDVFNCTWEEKTITQFEGTKRADSTNAGKIPDKPECFLAHMLKSDEPGEMVSLLKSARANLKQDASSDLHAWIQLRLAMLYYAQGNDQQALQELDAIKGFTVQGKGGFQKAVQDAYQQAGPAPLRVCEILSVAATYRRKNDGNFESDIDLDLADLGGYVDGTIVPVPNIVCPYFDVINLRLKGQEPDQNLSPTNAFASLGVQLFPVYQANLDADADAEWVGLLGKDSPQIVFVDRVDGAWKITNNYSEYFGDDSISNLQVKMLDVTGDRQPEVVISFAYQKRQIEFIGGYKKCGEDEHYFSLEILDVSDTDYNSLVNKNFECVTQSPFDTLSTQAMVDLYTQAKNMGYSGVQYPDWARFQWHRHKLDAKTILDDVSVIQKLVLANTEPERAQAEIKTMLASLPKGDSAADILREHLLYMSGYSYELQGNDENALAVYLSLIEKNPQSLWSRLAQSRISAKP